MTTIRTDSSIRILVLGVALLHPCVLAIKADITAAPAGVAERCFFAYYPDDNRLFARIDLTYVVIERNGRFEPSDRRIFMNGLDRPSIPSIKPSTLAALRRDLDRAQVEVVMPDGARVPVADSPMRDGRMEGVTAELPRAIGDFKIVFVLTGGGRAYRVEHVFERREFPWEGNGLGITDRVYAPFTPVKVAGKTIEVVQRRFTMNDFGLWDSVVAQGRELLARPMTVRYRLSDGTEGQWKATTPVMLTDRADAHATFHSAVEGPGVRLAAESHLEFDGCMKVQMTLQLGTEPLLIDSLWLELAVTEKEASLYHYLVNLYSRELFCTPNSGLIPPGTGRVWDSATIIRKYEGSRNHGDASWVNNFVPYLWLGGAERGVVWFAENDRGWFTPKTRDSRALQELSREDGALVFRVWLIAEPTTIREESRLTFGLQATPVKPMQPNAPSDPKNPNPNEWRKLSLNRPNWSGFTFAWGAGMLGAKGPYMDNWEIVDQICWAQLKNKGVMNKDWLDAFEQQFNPPRNYGNPQGETLRKMIELVAHHYQHRPMLVYTEVGQMPMTRGEFNTYQNQWAPYPYFVGRWNHGDLAESYLRIHNRWYPQAHSWVGPSINRAPSYVDYAMASIDGYLQRGVGIYFDNDFWWPNGNYHNSAAYQLPDGRVQPCRDIWAAREYHKRVWNRLQYWRENRKPNPLHEESCDPNDLEFSTHFSNCYVTPVNGFATINLNFEFAPQGHHLAFAPDFLRTEGTGRQTGCYMGKVYGLLSGQGPAIDALSNDDKARIEWGMSMVHEILRTDAVGKPTALDESGVGHWPYITRTYPKLEKLVRDFGYGERHVRVFNYWDDNPAATVASGLLDPVVNPEEPVKWLLLANPQTKEVLLVLASWAYDPQTKQPTAADTAVTLHPDVLGFTPAARVTDAETGEALSSDGAVKVHLPAPFGVRLVRWSQGVVE
jgi:hypothetical protein